MIPDMILRPKPHNDLGRRVFLVTMIAAAITFVASLLVPRYSGIVQLVALVFLCTALYFYTRYVASVYSYEVTADADGVPVFIVRQTAGSRSTTHCRMEIGHLTQVHRLCAEHMAQYRKSRRTAKKAADDSRAPAHLHPESDVAFYDYCVTFRPEEAMLLCFRARGEKADLLVEITEEFSAYLLDIAANARTLMNQEEE